MPIFNTVRRRHFRSARAFAFLGATLFTGCVADEPGLTEPVATGAAGNGNGAQNSTGAAASSANSGGQSGEQAGVAGSAGHPELGGSASGGESSNAGGDEASGGTAPEGDAGGANHGGEPAEEGVHIPPVCTFHDEPVPSEPGAGGAASDPATITVQLSPFLGSYLADATGRTLYTYGADLPGDCNTLPQSLCTADCLVSWPVFDAGARVLAEGLSDAGFGTILRGDGISQTTYMGWPLYYYKSDLTLGQLTGQGKGKTWHAAEVALPNVVIMKAGAAKWLADGAGRTLYVSAADQAGTADAEPVSNCSGACLATFEGFREKNLSVVTSLESLDFSVFVRPGTGTIQVAYKGLPLYRAATDLKSGDMNGMAVAGFTAAAP